MSLFPIVCYTIVGKPKGNLVSNIPKMSKDEENLLKNCLENSWESCNEFEKYMGILGNFIQKSGAVFFEASDYYGKRLVEYIFDIIDLLRDKGYDKKWDINIIYATRIVSFLFENQFNTLRKNYPVFFEEINKYLYSFYKLSKRNPLKSVIFQKFCYMLYLDPKLTMDVWRKNKFFKDIFYDLVGNTNLFEDFKEKSILLMGFVGLFSLHPEDFPDIISFSWFVKETLTTLMFLVEEKDKQINFIEEESNEDDSLDESFDEDEILNEKDYFYKDPLDFCPVKRLQGLFQNIEKQDPQYFGRILNELSPKEQNNLLKCFKFFDELRE